MAQLPIDTSRMDEVIEALKTRVGADAVFLVDVNGFMLTGTYTGRKFDLEGIASLSAGNYLSGIELAKLFNLDDFQSFFLGSGEKVDYFQIGGEGLFLAVLYPRGAPLAEVVEECKAALVNIQKLYHKERRNAGGVDVVLSDRRLFKAQAKSTATGFITSDKSSDELARCSFCQRTSDQVKKIVKGPKATICGECIKVISEVLFIDLI